MIALVRDLNISKYINNFKIKYLDDIEYFYYFLSDWESIEEEYKDVGWNKDIFLIKYNNNNVGYIRWEINRNHNFISNVDLVIDKQYLNHGIGIKASIKWLDYIFKRNYRKISIKAVVDNNRAIRIYDKIIGIGGKCVGVQKKHWQLRNNKYYDVVVYEILKENFKYSKYIKLLLPDFKLKGSQYDL